MSDVTALLTAEQAHRADHHWTVFYAVRLDPSLVVLLEKGEPCPHCGGTHDEDDDLATLSDAVVVATGDDGQTAIDLVKAHVYDEEKFGVRVVPGSFKLQGLKLTSVREI